MSELAGIPARSRSDCAVLQPCCCIWTAVLGEYFFMWINNGQEKPRFALPPRANQESVWDYPRPPSVVDSICVVEVRAGSQLIARTKHSKRVLETASPPTFYIPPDDIDFSLLRLVKGTSLCEWKGAASYWGLAAADNQISVGWGYAEPKRAFRTIKDWLCFYPGRVECLVNGEEVRPQEGGFYGGWVTDSIAGPWKGGPDTSYW